MNSFNKNDTIELTIDRMAQGGDGVARADGFVVFVEGGLPGEQVQARIIKRTADYARARIETILAPSPVRVEPRLPHASHIGWQHIAYDAQVQFKREIIAEQLARLAKTTVTVLPTIVAPSPWGYRNIAHLHVQGNIIGYHAEGTHTIIDIEHDPILLPVLNEVLAAIRVALQQDEYRGCVQHITLRASSTNGNAIALFTSTSPRSAASVFAMAEELQQQVPSLLGYMIQPHNTHQRPTQPDVLLEETIDDVVFSLSPESFFQVHTAQAAALLHVVRDGLALTPQDTLLDAYSGVGLFALPLARLVDHVIAIEESSDAVSDGIHSAMLNHINTVDYYTGSVERILPALVVEDYHIDAAILDPPRRGCHPAALDALIQLAPSRIAYISCQPSILARDLQRLHAAGYHTRSVQPVDMFPQTSHIESVVLLQRTEHEE